MGAKIKQSVMMVEDDEFTRSTVKSALEGKGLNIVYDTHQSRKLSNTPGAIVLRWQFWITT